MRSLLTYLALLGVAVTTSHLVAQDQGESSDNVIEANGDKFPIHITYFPAMADKVAGGELSQAPVVVLLHGEQESRLIWNKGSAPRGGTPFPAELQKRGYAVVTVDFRKHGESLVDGQKDSVKPDDYGKMVLGDLTAVKDFIQKEHQKQKLNMRKMAIVASGMSVPIAVGFAEYDWKQRPYDDAPLVAQRTPRGQDVQVLVLISPDQSAGRVQTAKPVNFLKSRELNIAFQVIVGSEDAKNFRYAKQVFDNFTSIKGNEERAEFVSPALKDSGLALMQRDPRAAYIPILAFLDKNLKTREIPWQDRRSRLER